MFGCRLFARLCLTLFALIFLPLAAAFAQSAAPANITSSVMDILMTIVTVFVGVIVYVVRSALAKWFGIQVTSAAVDAVNRALVNGAHDFIANHVLGGKPLTVDLKNAAANAALQYVNDHEPEAVARLGLDATTLEQKAQARAGSILNGILIAEPPASPAAQLAAAQ
jgi:hypothetical protein